MFDRAAESAEKLVDKISTIKNMIIDEMKFNPETGELTNFGAMTITLDQKSLEQEKEALRLWSERRQDTLEEWKKRYSAEYGDTYVKGISEALDNELAEADSNINSSFNNIQSTIMSMIGLITSAYEKERDAIIKVLNERKKSLQLAKDEYNFDKQLKENNDDVLKLQKQIAALRGQSDTEEGRSKLQKLEDQLKEAEEKRNETIQERMYNMQQQAFDDLNEDINDNYTDLINELKSTPEKIAEAIDKYLKAHGLDDESLTTGLQKLFGVYVGSTITSNSGITNLNPYPVQTGNGHTSDYNEYMPSSGNDSSTSITETVVTETPTNNNTKPSSPTYVIRDNADHYLYSNKLDSKNGYSDDRSDKVSGSINGYEVTIKNNAPEKTVDGKTFVKATVTDPNTGKSYTGYVNKNGIGDENGKKVKFAKGSRRIPKEIEAYTQDGGQELVYHHSDGSILTRLGPNDKVFTNAQTEKLWDLSKGLVTDGIYKSQDLILPSSHYSGDTSVNTGDFVFNVSGITDVNALVDELKHNTRFEKTIQSITVDRLAGKSKLKKYSM